MNGKLLRTLAALILTGLLMGVSGCGDGSDGNPPNFQTTLSIQDASGNAVTTFTVGQPITFVLSVQNLTIAPQTITFPTGQTLDYLVFGANQSPIVWRSSNGQAFTQAFTYLNFVPGETKTFSVLWNQQDNSGAAVGSGDYDAQGYLTTGDEIQNTFGANYTPSETRSMMVPFVIQ